MAYKEPQFCVKLSHSLTQAAKAAAAKAGSTVPTLMRNLLKNHLTFHATVVQDNWANVIKPWTVIRIYEAPDGFRTIVHDDIDKMEDIDRLLFESGDDRELLTITVLPNRNRSK